MRLVQESKQTPKAPGSVDASLQRMYDFYRTSLLNTKYFGYRLRQTNHLYLISELLIIFGSAASGVSGWAIWTYGITKNAWLVIAAISTLLVSTKPILQLNRKVERYSRLFTGHNANYLSMEDMEDIVQRIAISQAITPDLEREYTQLYRRYIQLSNEDDPNPPKKLVERLMSEVNEQVPPERLWWPA